jgi:PTS system cellobiose-specific IIA component
MEMTKTDQISFEMIARNGAARSLFIDAIKQAETGDFQEAERLMKEGESMLMEGHEIHGELITSVARGEEILMDLLLVHAEDQMMAAEMFKLLARQFMAVHKRLHELEKS